MLFNESFFRAPLLIILDLFDPMSLTIRSYIFRAFLARSTMSQKNCTDSPQYVNVRAMLILNVWSCQREPNLEKTKRL